MKKEELFLAVLGIFIYLAVPFKAEAAKCVSGFKIKECKTVFGDKPILKPEVKNTRGNLINRKLQIHNHFSNKVFVSFAKEEKLPECKKNIIKDLLMCRKRIQHTRGWITIAASASSIVDLPQSWNYIAIWSDEQIKPLPSVSINQEYLRNPYNHEVLFPQVKLSKQALRFCYPVTPPGGMNFKQKYIVKGKNTKPWGGAGFNDCPRRVHYKAHTIDEYIEYNGFYSPINSDTISVGR